MYGLDNAIGTLQPVAVKMETRFQTAANPTFIIGWQIMFHNVGTTGTSLTVNFDF